METSRVIILSLLLCSAQFPLYVFSQVQQHDTGALSEESLLSVMHSISSHSLLNYVTELASEKYQGRLTGTAGFNEAAQWAADLFKR